MSNDRLLEPLDTQYRSNDNNDEKKHQLIDKRHTEIGEKNNLKLICGGSRPENEKKITHKQRQRKSSATLTMRAMVSIARSALGLLGAHAACVPIAQ